MTIEELAQLLKQIPASELVTFVNVLVANPTAENVTTLENLLLIRESYPNQPRDTNEFVVRFIARYSARMFLVFQEDGLKTLVRILLGTPGPTYPTNILDTLFYTSRNTYVPGLRSLGGASELLYTPPITDSMAKLAVELLRELIIQSQSNSRLFGHFLKLLGEHDPEKEKIRYGADSGFRELWLSTIRESIILLSQATLSEFEHLINIDVREEDYQRFLESNPVLLDPLARRVISKQQLGEELITDFVVEKLTGEYIMVEIEKPSDTIFTRKNDFRSEFIHAYGQVLDFQEWIESNIAYAQTRLPGIAAPTGLLIIGRRQSLTEKQVRKLARLNTNHSGRVTVLCFDDVLDAGKRLYNNMYRAI